MTATTASPAASAARPVRWFIADTATVTARELLHWRNRPGVMAFGWFFPVMIMLIFVGLLGGAIGAPAGASYLDFVMPGVLAMTMFFGLEGTMTAMLADVSSGITDRFRSLPMSGAAVIAGRCVADLLNSLVGLTLVAATGLLLGWRPDAPVHAAAAALGLLILLRIAMLWIGAYLGLRVRNQEAVNAIQVLVWPLLFLSSVFVDTATMPSWLGVIADANPLSQTVTAVRGLLGEQAGGGASWFADNASALAIVVPIALTAVFLPLAARRWRRLSR
ncbi:ABC-2 type transport system permease protein [Diaminobutyricimonas aerilata]|uniref:Transport permease protein n=1 Tax=Diaminobutyricimonas aerilata TaxID=1162967 RepID=A0A2M9CFJ7_9MICO|nr:ABC transporter permease [Diaminobutyricimonas aerilata]PJJ70622.1 ABC-2 type transport system permease protein [Diaminobutyricimonas aerilata]